MPLHPFTRELKNHRVAGNETTNEEYETHNGSFATYFRNKQVKLDTQAKVHHAQSSTIFSECIIYITGYTTPSFTELKRLVVENGGQICAFLGGKSYATHVVAATLTSRKMELYANMKVVKPSWVTESVKMGKKLDWTKYRTIQAVRNRTLTEQIDSPESIEAGEEADEAVDAEAYDEASAATNVDVSEANERGDLAELIDIDGPEGDAARIEWILANRHRVNCMDPNFLSEYFSKSRLHFISMRKLELRQRCRNFVRQKNIHDPLPVRRTLLHVDFDSFFVAVAQKKHPHLASKPVCVSNGSNGSDIASCNYVARQRGVKNGMWVGRAKITCPDLVCLPYDFEEYTRCSDILYDTLIGLNPLHITAISVDEAMVDVSNLVNDCSVLDVCGHIRSEIKQLTGIEVSVGVGSNILLAKVALKRAKPAGVHVISEPTEITDFNVRDLPGVGHHVYSQLSRIFAVQTLRQLQGIPLSELQASIGNALGQKLYGYSRGMDSNDILSLDVPIRTIGLDIGWGVRLISEAEKTIFIKYCVDELYRRLTNSGATMETITIKIYAKSESATFVPPKYMGCGLCDITSKSKRVLPRMTLDELKQNVTSLVQSVECPPLLFRGLGIHVKVNDESRTLVGTANPGQSLITDVCKTPKSKKTEMVAVPPRKRHRIAPTLTQMMPGPHSDARDTHHAALVGETLRGEVDMSVLAELPSQIRKEVFLHEDDYNLPVRGDYELGAPMFKQSKFLDMRSPKDIRRVIKEWVQTSEMPNAEDAQTFYDYICGAARDDSSWVQVLDINEWLQTMVKFHAQHRDWRELCHLVDAQIQQILLQRI